MGISYQNPYPWDGGGGSPGGGWIPEDPPYTPSPADGEIDDETLQEILDRLDEIDKKIEKLEGDSGEFVNTELPKRPVLIKGPEEAMGDPNLSELQKINDAPIGSFYMQFDADNKLWQKTAEGKEGWTVVGGSSGSGGPLDPNLQALMEKKIIIPKIYTSEDVVTTDSIKITTQEDEEIVIGSVNIVDQSTGQIIIRNGVQVTGTINEEGEVFFNQTPRSDIRIVYGVKVLLNELPEDFLKRHFYTDDDERNMLTIIDDINELEKDLIKENIKPTGLYTNTTEEGTTITFSYTDDPNLDYFVLERFDEATGRWVPYDGKEGIIVP